MSAPLFNLSDYVLDNFPSSEAATLALDAESLAIEELSLPALMRELDLQQRPNWLLRKIVSTLEETRQNKGLGWARTWNECDQNIFRIHTQDQQGDGEYFAALTPLLVELLPQVPALYQGFALQLLVDPGLMAFTFYHNHEAIDGQYEGLTLSFGRKVARDTDKLDRLDLVLEDKRVNGRVNGRIDRLRLYVSPWSLYRHGRTHYHSIQSGQALDLLTPAQTLYEDCVRHYHRWKNVESRQWSHWSARYIDYYGPRSFIPIGSSFS